MMLSALHRFRTMSRKVTCGTGEILIMSAVLARALAVDISGALDYTCPLFTYELAFLSTLKDSIVLM